MLHGLWPQGATWPAVNISPDGRTVVFDILGDIYTVPIDGGPAQAISRGPAYDHHAFRPWRLHKVVAST